jgi:hypothetical protein
MWAFRCPERWLVPGAPTTMGKSKSAGPFDNAVRASEPGPYKCDRSAQLSQRGWAHRVIYSA